jgi:glyoxylase-like metal-dependent hydrolase (beta-lactamase superfamily II)
MEEDPSISPAKMDLIVKTIKNNPIDSNCFIIYTNINSDCILVDPGTEDCEDLLFFLEQNNLVPNYIILTHEHFDHIWGINKMLELFDSTLICSEKCLELIADKKKNLSIFYNQIGFEILPRNFKIVSNEIITLGNYVIQFKEILGHSLGSVSFWIDNLLFTGDVFIKDTKTVTKLPGGSKKQLVKTYEQFKELFYQKEMIVYPGHGEIFPFKEINFNQII